MPAVVAEALPVAIAVLALILASIVVFAARVVLVGRPQGAPSVGRWSAAAFLGAWWRWVRRAESTRPRPAARLARVIPLDAARRDRAAR